MSAWRHRLSRCTIPDGSELDPYSIIRSMKRPRQGRPPSAVREIRRCTFDGYLKDSNGHICVWCKHTSNMLYARYFVLPYYTLVHFISYIKFLGDLFNICILVDMSQRYIKFLGDLFNICSLVDMSQKIYLISWRPLQHWQFGWYTPRIY